MAIKAVAYYLDRFALATSDEGIITGLTYTDVNALLPAKSILKIKVKTNGCNLRRPHRANLYSGVH